MMIHGPRVTKTVTIPEHTEEVIDADAYWHLDWEGNEDPEGTFWFARVAFPRLADAQRQNALLRAEAERSHAAKPRRRRSRARS